MEIDTLVKNVIKVCYEVHNELGHGFSEKVYEKSLGIALVHAHMKSEAQYPMTVYFRGVIVGEFFADLLVEERLILELKAVTVLDSSHKSQVLNYLKASRLQTGLIVNFGAPKMEIKRLYNNELIKTKA